MRIHCQRNHAMFDQFLTLSDLNHVLFCQVLSHKDRGSVRKGSKGLSVQISSLNAVGRTVLYMSNDWTTVWIGVMKNNFGSEHYWTFLCIKKLR